MAGFEDSEKVGGGPLAVGGFQKQS